MPLTAQDVAEITRLLEASDFDELHIESDGLKLTLKRAAAVASAEPKSSSAEPARAVHQPPPGPALASDASISTVPAPLLGTFYRAPKPGAPPYVEVGSQVRENTIIGIIEVMKLMNTVRAGVEGQVVEILAQDGSLVEYGQVLLRVSPGSRP